MKTIPFFDYPGIYKRFENDFDSIFKEVCSRGSFILQKDLEDFEHDLCKFLNVKHAFGVADGTNAMVLGLMASGINPQDEIIIASHTYIATAAAIKAVNAIPIFADIGNDGMILATSVEKAITNKTVAVMPTQLNGRCCDMDKINAIAKKNNLKVFEDSAQGLGAKFDGKSAGTFGMFGTFSFYPAKLLGCFGDGGAIVTNDDKIAEKIYLLRDHGRNEQGEVVAWGTNSRLDNLQAAFLNFKLKHFSQDIKRRREIANLYDVAFQNNPNIYPPPGPDKSLKHFDVYQNYEMAFERRDSLKSYLSEKGIGTIIQWAGSPVHHFENLGYGINNFHNLKQTDWFFERCLMLPMHMGLTDEQIKYIIENVLEFYKSNEK